MNLVDSLLEGAEADRDVLKKQLAMGDDPSIPRDVDFVLYAKDLEKAELVRDFVHDNSYGRSFVQEVPQNPPDSQHRIIVQVFMPTTQHALCAVSALMACLAKLYDLAYDGWGCEITKESNKPAHTTAGSAPV
jgi:regulator of RNase E activity RraB